MSLTFNKENHEYRIDGVVIPSVTQVIEAVGLSNFGGVNNELLERAAAFGDAVHAAINYKCKGTLDEDSIDPALIPYLQGWENFVEDYGYVRHETEYCGHSELYRFGFTIDQMGVFNGKAIHMGKVLVDIKTGHPYPAHKYQMAGYVLGAGKEYKNIILLYLNPEFHRGYKVVFSKNNKREQSVFLAALTIYNVRREEGLL